MATILIVEDSPTEAHFLSEMLRRNGFQTLIAADAEDGIQQARSHKPDVILMDLVMPGLNGFQATRLLTRDAETSSIPVVVVSSKGQETDKVWAQRQGARDYVTKPVNEDDLLRKLSGLISS